MLALFLKNFYIFFYNVCNGIKKIAKKAIKYLENKPFKKTGCKNKRT